jgi:hypothetical protein
VCNRRAVVVALSATGLLAALPAAAQSTPPDSVLEYAIMRSGDQIGTHRIAFRREGDRLTVDINVNVQVRVLGITAYRFTQTARETWRGDRLVTLESSGNDDGTPYTVRVREAEGGLVAEARGNTVRFPAEAVALDVWNPAQLQRSVVIDTIEGAARRPSVRDIGERSFVVNGRPVVARGSLLEVPPDYQRWYWFSANGRLIHLELHGRDGSLVEYVLR